MIVQQMKIPVIFLWLGLPVFLYGQDPGVIRLLARSSSPEQYDQATRRSSLPEQATIRSLLPEPSPEARIASTDPYRYYLIEWNGKEVATAIRELRSTGMFDYVEPDAIGEAATSGEVLTPNDPFFSRQWSHNNNGTFPLLASKTDADADLPEAWEITTGSESVIVAVLDSGIKPDHPEFSGRLWQNKNEIDGNDIDDDHNGYTDDVHGWNMTVSNADIRDHAGHGTHVAGIIGASGNNTIGYAGVDWKCKLMICKVLEDNLSGYYSWWVEAIHYAVDQGADIINMSLGGTDYSRTLEDAIAYARSRDVLVIASMQNYNSAVPYYPAGYAAVLAVGATDPNDQRSKSFSGSGYGSNYGDHLDIVAPGNYIYGLSHTSDTNYDVFFSGTSQAAPLVSGIAALVRSHDPEISADEVEQRILASAEDGVGDALEDTPGWDQYYGYGRVNAYRALTVTTSENKLYRLSVYPNPSHGEVTITLDQRRSMPAELTILSITGQLIYTMDTPASRIIERSLNLENVPAGLYFIRLRSATGYHQVKWVKH